MPGQILIVEDERSIADTIAYALKTEGFDPRWCERGQEALALVQGGDFRLVILDVGLPDLSGFEVCRRLRTFSTVPVVFLTARGEEVDRIVGLEIGADDYVTKPFSPRELVARVRVILRRAEAREPDRPVRLAPPARFALDAAGHRVWCGGVALDLTRYEFGLLATLLSRPGGIFTRVQLMESVWAQAEDTTDRTVDTHVKTLRAKLRTVLPQADPIQTHRGVGYSFERSLCD